MFHLKVVFFSLFIISSSTFASVRPSDYFTVDKTLSANNSEKRAARAIEDFYWAFRKNNSKVLKNSLAILKKSKSRYFYKYLPVLSKGLNLTANKKSENPIPCDTTRAHDEITRKFLNLYQSRCFENNFQNLLNTKSFNDKWLNFIKDNFSTISRYRYRKDLIPKLESLKGSQKVYFSDLLRNHIFSKVSLPPKDFLPFLIVDKKLTSFIQHNKLFEVDFQKEYSSEFKKLVSDFKQQYLDGNDIEAKESLEDAITFYENNSNKINNKKAWQIFITSGKKLARKDDNDLAIELFKLSVKVGDEDQTMESKFQHLFTYYNERQFDSALEYIKREKLLEDFSELSSKLQYWIAKITLERKEYKQAKEMFKTLIATKPLSFYAILSLKELRKVSNNYGTNLLINEEPLSHKHLKLSDRAFHALSLFHIFNEVESNLLSSIQATEIRKIPSTQFFSNIPAEQSATYKAYYLIRFFSENQNHLSSFKIAYTAFKKNTIKLNPLVISSLFPRKFTDLLKKHNDKLDHNVVLSLIRQESAFNTKATSVVGARGLMQIMPATGRQFKRRLKDWQLYNPELNIKIGTKYLTNLVDRYEGNLVFSLASYNAGIGNVSRWLKSIPFGNDMVANIEMIPFKETRNYVKLIYRNIFFYNYMDGKNDFIDLPINDSFVARL